MSKPKCLDVSCNKESHAKGLCGMHYRRLQRKENPEQRKWDLEYTRKRKEKNPQAHSAQQARRHERLEK